MMQILNLTKNMELQEKIRRNAKLKPKAATINRAILHQQRLKFHCQTVVTTDLSQAVSDFLAFVQNLIPHDKFVIFKTLFRFPLKTNEVTGIIFDKLSRIFDGRNAALNYQFSDSSSRDDWEVYRKEKLHEPEIWQTLGFENFKTEINSVIIVDVRSGENNAPEPYFYWLPINFVIDYEAKPSGEMIYISFRQDGNKIAVIDSEAYRIYSDDNGTIGSLIEEHRHNLGYCPARFFWSEPISLENPDVKCSPLSKELDNLDWYLFYHLSKRHLDLYAAYPIYSGYEQACDFSNEENGDYCDGGFIKNKQGFYKTDINGLMIRCPKCGNKRIAGVGSFVEIPIPTEGQPDLRNPVQILTVDRNSLDYNVDECARLKNEIITAVVGTAEDVQGKEAINENQVKATFESQSAILRKVKKGFEIAQKFVDETICRLRYGSNFISCSINYGTEFYLYDLNELRERYKIAKENGASDSELDALQTAIIETEYRHNPAMLERMLILSDLEPLKHLTTQEVINLYKENIISAEKLKQKINFIENIKRFERENTNILTFGKDIDYKRKIENINKVINTY